MILVVGKYIYLIIMGMVMSAMEKPKPAPVRPLRVASKGKAAVVLMVGDKVRLKKKTFQLYVARDKDMQGGLKITEARIEYFFSHMNGLAKLEHKLGGYWSWNVEDLEKVK